MLVERDIDRPTPLTRLGILEHEAAVRRIDEVLESLPADDDGRLELECDRTHLLRELRLGQLLPLPKDDDTWGCHEP